MLAWRSSETMTPNDLWILDLDAPPLGVAALEAVLSPDERAGRFRFECDRRRYAVGRGLVRHVLASRTGAAPSSLSFEYGAHGKPRLRETGDGSALGFNMSHSERVLVLALTGGAEVGVDVEVVRPMTEGVAVAETVFTAREREGLALPPDGDDWSRFYRLWTAKEAFLKALGSGLSVAPHEVEVHGDGHGLRFSAPATVAAGPASRWRGVTFRTTQPVSGEQAVGAVVWAGGGSWRTHEPRGEKGVFGDA
jgi:4'-phosphopantetheinyl transferase